MLKTVRMDLESISDTLEHIAKTLPRLTQQEKVDLGARVSAFKNSAEALDKLLRDEFKTSLKHQPGELPGESFKAKLTVYPMPRLDQGKLKDKYPRAYFACINTGNEERMTYHPK
jgi:hypothetical protein